MYDGYKHAEEIENSRENNPIALRNKLVEKLREKVWDKADSLGMGHVRPTRTEPSCGDPNEFADFVGMEKWKGFLVRRDPNSTEEWYEVAYPEDVIYVTKSSVFAYCQSNRKMADDFCSFLNSNLSSDSDVLQMVKFYHTTQDGLSKLDATLDNQMHGLISKMLLSGSLDVSKEACEACIDMHEGHERQRLETSLNTLEVEHRNAIVRVLD